jgi:hypothetical protein
MNYARLKIWSVVTFSLAATAIVIRAIWQIVVIPTGGTMLIFIPLILALLFAEFLIIYLVRRPERLKSLPFTVGITITFSAGLVAGVTHFVRFIISDKADPFWSKVVSALVLAASVSAYSLLLYAVWSLRRVKKNG